MTHDEAVKWLKDIRDNSDARSYSDALSRGKALDYAIAELVRKNEWVCEDHPNKPWGGVSNSPDACHCGGAGALRATQFDERIAEISKFIEVEMEPFKQAVKIERLLKEMQSHIRKLESRQ